MNRNKIWVIAIAIICSFFVVSCGDNSSQDPIVSEKPSNRLDELRANKEQKVNEEKAQRAYEKAMKESEKAEKEKARQKQRDAITSNGKLLDEIIGDWGFVSPAWVGKNPTGDVITVDPRINYYSFLEDGRVVWTNTYIFYDDVLLNTSSGDYAIDEEKNVIYIIYDDIGKKESEIHYEYDGNAFKMYGGWLGYGKYNDSFKTELFKESNWIDLLTGNKQHDVDYISNLAKDNPNLVPEFFINNKENSEITSKLVGEWGYLAPTATYHAEYSGHYHCRPSTFVFEFLEGGKLIVSYTKPDEDGISVVEGAYYINEDDKKIQLVFGSKELHDTELTYEIQDDKLIIYMGFYFRGYFDDNIQHKLTKTDWKVLLDGIDKLSRNRRDDFIYDLVKNNPECVPSYYKKEDSK